MKDLTIAILNYNSGEYLSKCLDSVNNISGEANVSTVVIDNNSTDESFTSIISRLKNVEFIATNLKTSGVNPRMKITPSTQYEDKRPSRLKLEETTGVSPWSFIKNNENLGFSKGYNNALKNIKTEFVLLLNPDCILEKGVIKRILEDFDDQKIGAATCKIILPDSKIDLTAHRGFPTPWASLLYIFGNDSLYHLRDKISGQVHEVDSIAGAFFMTKKSVLEKVGYLDERFFLYGEDIDLCMRIKQVGFKIIYDPRVQITHFKGISSGLKKHSQELSMADKKTRERAKDSFYKAMILFYDKHYKNKYPFFVSWLIYLGVYLKWNFAKLKATV